MFLEIGGKEYELKTTLGVAKTLEEKFKKTTVEIMANLAKTANISDMLIMLKTAFKDKSESEKFEKDILENMDYFTVQKACDTLLMNICFGGSPEEQEKKISDFPASALRKNIMRRALDLPIPETTDSTSEKSSEQPIE